MRTRVLIFVLLGSRNVAWHSQQLFRRCLGGFLCRTKKRFWRCTRSGGGSEQRRYIAEDSRIVVILSVNIIARQNSLFLRHAVQIVGLNTEFCTRLLCRPQFPGLSI